MLLIGFLFCGEVLFLAGRKSLRSIGHIYEIEALESQMMERQLLQVQPYQRFYPDRTTQFEPTPTYFASLIVYALPGFIIAIITMIVGIIFCICYGGCHKCGWKARSPQKHPRRDVITMQALLISISVFVAGGCVVGMYGNWLFSKGVQKLLGSAVNATNEVVIKVDNITEIMVSIDPAFTSYMQSLNLGLVQIQTEVSDAQDNVYAYDVFRDLLVHFGFLTALITGGVGLAAGITRENPVALAMGIMGFITIFMMASSFGIHLAVSIMMDDLCARASNFIQQPQNVTLSPTADTALQIILTCLRNGSFFPAFSAAIADAQQALIELDNLTTTYLNYTFDPTLNQSASADEAIQEAIAKINGVITVIQNDVNQLPNSYPGKQQLQDKVNELQAIVTALNLLLEIIDCSQVSTFAQTILDSVCETMLMGTVMIYCGAGFLVAVFTIETIFALVGSHRFKRKKTGRYALYHGNKFFRVVVMCITQCIQGIVTFVLAEEYPVFFIVAVAFFMGISFLGFFGAMCRSKPLVFFFALCQTIGTGLLLALLVTNVVTVKSCSQVNDFTGNCTHYQRALDIEALILTCFDVIISGLGMFFAWQLFNNLRAESKNRSEAADYKFEMGQRADSFVNPPVNMNGQAVENGVPHVRANANAEAMRPNRVPNQKARKTRSRPPVVRTVEVAPVIDATFPPPPVQIPPPLQIPAPPSQPPQRQSSQQLSNSISSEPKKDSDSESEQSSTSYSDTSGHIVPYGTPAQKSGNIQNRHSTESDPSENASVSGDEKHNGSGQDTGSSSLSASEETSF